MDLTVRFLAWLLSLCTPRPRGRHRLNSTEPQGRFTPAEPPRFTEILDGNASRLVRPYTPDPYLRPSQIPCQPDPAERHHQRARRRALYLATLGIDTGPDFIHGIRVGAGAGVGGSHPMTNRTHHPIRMCARCERTTDTAALCPSPPRSPRPQPCS